MLVFVIKKKVVDPASDTDDKADTDIEVDLCNDLESSSSHSNTHIDHRKIRRQCLNRPRSSPSPHDDEAGTASPEPVSIKFVRLAFILILSCAISFCILNKRRIQLNTLQQLCCLKRGNTQFSHFLSFFVDEIFKFLIEVVYSFNKTFSFSLLSFQARVQIKGSCNSSDLLPIQCHLETKELWVLLWNLNIVLVLLNLQRYIFPG